MQDVLKLAVVFLIIIIFMWLKKPISAAVLAAGIGTVLLYGLSPGEAAAAAAKGAFERTTAETLLVFYSITYLQRMMEKRKNLSGAHQALNGLFNNNRINASLAPFLLGMLPAAGTVLICGPIVRESVKDSLSVEEAACVTSYYRHISESFLPTYTSIFIAIAMTGGRVSAPAFILAMLPMVAALMFTGWLVYLRKVPKDTGMAPDQPRGYYWRLLAKSVWPIALTIALILILGLPVELAVLGSILVNVKVNRFGVRECLPFFKTAFEARLLLNTWLVMIFKEILTAAGVIAALPGFFSGLPIPAFLIFSLIFLFGTIVAGTQAMIVLCMPMAMATVAAGHTGLALFVLLMCITYVSMQISPVHICLLLCAEDYGISLGALVKKTLPLVAVFTAIAMAYYGILSAFGF